jgi:hypothetical protein
MPAPPRRDCYRTAVVTDDPAAVDAQVRAGVDVVLLVDLSAGHVPRSEAGPGRVALLIVASGDETARAVAAQMDAELFGRPELRTRRGSAGPPPVPPAEPG